VRGSFGNDSGANGDFIEADCCGLPQIHGGLAGVGGNFDEMVAEGEVFAGEAVFLGAKDEGDPGRRLLEFVHDVRSQLIEPDHGLLWLAVGECASAKDEGGVADGFPE